MSSVSRLHEVAQRVDDYIASNAATSAASRLGRTSPFWTDIFAARPKPSDLNALLAIRRSPHLLGIGDDRLPDPAQEAARAAQVAQLVQQFVPRAFLAGLEEPAHGAPLVFAADGITMSAAFRLNAGTTYRVRELLRRFGPSGRPLRICEIGPGWGCCALQLHQVLDVDNYALVDLPQNLYLSTTYLAGALPERPLELLDIAGPRVTALPSRRVVAMLPAAIERLSCRFDVILNSFSLQEMDAETVNAYLDWAAEALAEDGVLVSFNAHGKAGIDRAGDYGFGRFHLRRLAPFRRTPSGLFNTIPYEAVLGRRAASSPILDEAAFSTLADLMQLGLDEDLAVILERVVAGGLGDADRRWLSLVDRCFAPDASDRDRLESLAAAGPLDGGPVTMFLEGNLLFAIGDIEAAETALATAQKRGLHGFAKLRGELLGALARRRAGCPSSRVTLPDNAETEASAVYPEISDLLTRGDAMPVRAHIDRVLRRRSSSPDRWWRKAPRRRVATGAN